MDESCKFHTLNLRKTDVVPQITIELKRTKHREVRLPQCFNPGITLANTYYHTMYTYATQIHKIHQEIVQNHQPRPEPTKFPHPFNLFPSASPTSTICGLSGETPTSRSGASMIIGYHRCLYGTFTYIYHKSKINVGTYSKHMAMMANTSIVSYTLVH